MENENINGYIYILIDIRNNKKYIGKHIINKNKHTDNYFTGGKIPKKLIKLYGKNIFERKILDNNINTYNELNNKEKYYINEYNTLVPNGYNLTKGGDGGGYWIYLKTQKEKDVISNKKRLKMKNRIFSKETLEKMSIAKKGKKLSIEHKNNIKLSQSGINHPWYNRKHTIESKNKISKSKKGNKNILHSIWMKHNNPRNRKIKINGIEYKSITNAAEELNLSRAIIKNRCNNKKWTNYEKL